MNRFTLFLYHACRLSLGGIFLYAGLIKSSEVTSFAGDIANYRILPYSWNFLAAAILPYIEALAGFLLVISRMVRASALLLGVLDLVFIVALASVIARGMDIDCGCFKPAGAEGGTAAPLALVRDIGIMILVVVTFYLRGKQSHR